MPERTEQSPEFDSRALARDLLEYDVRTARQIRGDRALARLLPTRDERRGRSAEPALSTGDVLTEAMRELRELLRRLFRRGGNRPAGQGTDAGGEAAPSPGDARAPGTETLTGAAPGLGGTPPEEERRRDRPNLFRRTRTALGDLWSLARTLADRRTFAETPPYARYEKLSAKDKMATDRDLADLIKTERRYEKAYERNDLPISGALAGNTEEAPQVDFDQVGTDLSAERLLALVDQRLSDDSREVRPDLSAEHVRAADATPQANIPDVPTDRPAEQFQAVESTQRADLREVDAELSPERLLALVDQRLRDGSLSRTTLSATSDEQRTAAERGEPKATEPDRQRAVGPSPSTPPMTARSDSSATPGADIPRPVSAMSTRSVDLYNASPPASPASPVSPVSPTFGIGAPATNVAATANASQAFLQSRGALSDGPPGSASTGVPGSQGQAVNAQQSPQAQQSRRRGPGAGGGGR